MGGGSDVSRGTLKSECSQPPSVLRPGPSRRTDGSAARPALPTVPEKMVDRRTCAVSMPYVIRSTSSQYQIQSWRAATGPVTSEGHPQSGFSVLAQPSRDRTKRWAQGMHAPSL